MPVRSRIDLLKRPILAVLSLTLYSGNSNRLPTVHVKYIPTERPGIMSDSAEDPPILMPCWSGYSGEPFNLTERRPLNILGEADDTITANGFYYQGTFWKAIIPKRGVAEIFAQQFNFSKHKRQADGGSKPSIFFLNHVQARVKMTPESAIALYAASGDANGEPVHRITDFCHSVEAVGPHGRSWNVADALLGNLAVVHRFLSTTDVAFERIILSRMTVLQSPPLPLEADIRDQLLCAAIRRSHDVGLTKPYFMARMSCRAANCTSEPLNIVDDIRKAPPWQHFFHRLPIHPRSYLKVRGLWQDGKPTPTLNDEMADWLASEEAKQRRAIHLQKKKELGDLPQAPKIPIWKNVSSFIRAIRA